MMNKSISPFPQLLSSLLSLAAQQKDQGFPVKVVFDLDSTLFDVSPRISEILRNFAKLPEIKTDYPSEAQLISELIPHINDYGVKRTLERMGFKWPSQEFAMKIIAFWKTHFFANTYLIHDAPYEGAQEFVRELLNAGAEIYYLTGRDIPRMWKGTVDQLKFHGFPLDPNHTNLILKPNSEITDVEFKGGFFQKLEKTPNPIWFFENEPANIYSVMERCPHIKIVFVETVHSENLPPPPDHVDRIKGFK